eukprot:1147909-Pelagomonas_calceolata.AAC.1
MSPADHANAEGELEWRGALGVVPVCVLRKHCELEHRVEAGRGFIHSAGGLARPNINNVGQGDLTNMYTSATATRQNSRRQQPRLSKDRRRTAGAQPFHPSSLKSDEVRSPKWKLLMAEYSSNAARWTHF